MNLSMLSKTAMAVGLALLTGCQSAEEREAEQRRGRMRETVEQIKTLETELLAEYQAYIEERSDDPRTVTRVRRRVATAKTRFPGELADLQQRIDEAFPWELPAVEQSVTQVLSNRKRDLGLLKVERQHRREIDEISARHGLD